MAATSDFKSFNLKRGVTYVTQIRLVFSLNIYRTYYVVLQKFDSYVALTEQPSVTQESPTTSQK